MCRVRMKSRLAIHVLLVALTVSTFVMFDSVQAQCIPRTDWQTYRVIRGDTLSRIALRSHSTVAALALANCLRNINLIYVGQILRIPSNNATPSPIPYPTQTANARIISFVAQPNPAQSGGTLTLSWQVTGTQYTLLTVLDATTNQPLAIVQQFPTTGGTTVQVPITGTSAIRLILHAANLTTTYPVNMYERLAESSITIPVMNNSNQTSVTTHAAYQSYYQGFMIWRADTGSIYTFGLGLGTYPQSTYAGLPDNVCTDVPAGSVCPINGFGRIWANDVNTRRYMGWATAPEQGYQATIVMQGGSVTTISLPDGRTVHIDNGTTWHF